MLNYAKTIINFIIIIIIVFNLMHLNLEIITTTSITIIIIIITIVEIHFLPIVSFALFLINIHTAFTIIKIINFIRITILIAVITT